MESELIALNVEEIFVQQGYIDFPEYKQLKAQAVELAELLATKEVDAENIKESKKLLAAVNKVVNELETKRKSIKNCMLAPYSTFEQQVKEIVEIVKEADEIVRQQVKALEEKDRQDKKEILEQLFNKRIVHYSFRDLFTFNDFLKPQHLNKTASIDATEKEMILYIDQLAKDLKAIESMPAAKEILTIYIETRDLAAALTTWQRIEDRKQLIEQAKVIKQPQQALIAYLVSVQCSNEKELKLLEMLLDQNGFEYNTDKITGGK